MEKMISFLYTADYDDDGIGLSESSDDENDSSPPQSALQLHAHMFSLGEKYSIKGLCELSTEKYKTQLNHCSPLEFLRSIPSVYDMTPDSVRALRDEAKKFAGSKLKDYIKGKSTDIQEVYENVASDVPDFVKDCLDAFIEMEYDNQNCSYCHGARMTVIQRYCNNCERSCYYDY